MKKLGETQVQYQGKIIEEMKKIREDQLAELKKMREDQQAEISNQTKSNEEISKLREAQGELISIVRKLVEKLPGEKKENQNQLK